jgi:hypothetical protein
LKIEKNFQVRIFWDSQSQFWVGDCHQRQMWRGRGFDRGELRAPVRNSRKSKRPRVSPTGKEQFPSLRTISETKHLTSRGRQLMLKELPQATWTEPTRAPWKIKEQL